MVTGRLVSSLFSQPPLPGLTPRSLASQFLKQASASHTPLLLLLHHLYPQTRADSFRILVLGEPSPTDTEVGVFC